MEETIERFVLGGSRIGSIADSLQQLSSRPHVGILPFAVYVSAIVNGYYWPDPLTVLDDVRTRTEIPTSNTSAASAHDASSGHATA